MKVIYNNYIPVRGYVALTLWPFVFVRNSAIRRYTLVTANHESIHGMQQRETLCLVFFLWYAVEYIIRLVIYRSRKEAYRNISFEQESYIHESDLFYLSSRRPYAFIRYVRRKTFHL